MMVTVTGSIPSLLTTIQMPDGSVELMVIHQVISGVYAKLISMAIL
jgi:hypothetical protein